MIFRVLKQPFAFTGFCFAGYVIVMTFFRPMIPLRVATAIAVLGLVGFGFEVIHRRLGEVFFQNAKALFPWLCFIFLCYLLLPLVPFAADRARGNLTALIFAGMAFCIVRTFGKLPFLEELFFAYIVGVVVFWVMFPELTGAAEHAKRLRIGTGVGSAEEGLNPNDVGRLMGVAGLILLWRLRKFTTKELLEGITARALLDIGTILCVVATVYVIIVHTGSRSAMIWVGGMTGFCVAAKYNRNVVMSGVAAILFGGVVLVGLFFAFPDAAVVQRTTILFDESQLNLVGEGSYFIRAEMMEEALRMWTKSPIWGNGNEAFRVYSGFGTYSHANYTELLANYGILGILLFYTPFIVGAIQAWRLRTSPSEDIRRQAIWLLIACLMLFLISFVNVIYYSKYMMLFYGFVLGRIFFIKDNQARLNARPALVSPVKQDRRPRQLRRQFA